MNIVFWLLIILCLAGIWVLLSPFFNKIGRAVRDEINTIKSDMDMDKEDKNE